MNLREFVISVKIKMAEARGRLGELKGEFSKAADSAKNSGKAMEDAGKKSEKSFNDAAAASQKATKATKENEEAARSNAAAADKVTSSWGKMGAVAGKVIGGMGKGFKGLNIPTNAIKDFNKELTRIKSSSTPLGMLTKGFLGLSAAALGARGLMDFFANTVNNDAMLGRTGRSIGSSPTGLNAWGTAFQASGGTQQDASQSIGRLQDAFTSYKMTGSMQGINEGAMMKLLGANYRRIMSQGGEKTMFALADASKRFSAPEYSWLLRQLGLNESAVAVLSKGEPALRQLIEDAERAHKITQDNTKAAQDLQEAWAKFANSSKGIFSPLVRGLDEFIAKTLNAGTAVNELEEKANKHPEKFKEDMKNANATPIEGNNKDERISKNSHLYSQDELNKVNPKVGAGFLAEMRRDIFGANDEEKKAIDILDHQREEKAKKDAENQKNGIPSSDDSSSDSGSGAGSTVSEIKKLYDKAQSSKKGGDGHTALDLNNTGGIIDGDFARRQPGYMGGDGHFARFRTLEDGINAERHLLQVGYLNKGYDTPHRIAYKWASGKTDDPETYARQLADKLHIGVDGRIDPARIEELVKAIAGNENSGINGHGRGGGYGGIENHFHGNFTFGGSSNDPHDHARQFAHEFNQQIRASSFNTGQD